MSKPPSALELRHGTMPAEMWREIAAINDAIAAHATFRVITHSRPDGDALGSALALYFHLAALGKTVRVFTEGPVPRHFKFLPGFERIETQWDEAWVPEVTIYVDCGGIDRASEKDLRRGAMTISIDHHVGTPHFGALNYLDSAAAAAGEQVYHLVKAARAPITCNLAVCLYVAIVSDTGNFKYTNAEAHVFDIATELIQAGAVPADICMHLFESRAPEAVKLMGEVLAGLHFDCGGRLCWAEITQAMYARAGGEKNEPEGLVGDLRAVDGVKMAMLLHEMPDGRLRASLRSKNGTNVRDVAVSCGGGGHIHASGVLMDAPYAAAREKLLAAARRAFAGAPAPASK